MVKRCSCGDLRWLPSTIMSLCIVLTQVSEVCSLNGLKYSEFCCCTENLRWDICSVILQCDLYIVRKERTDTLSNIPEKWNSCVLISTWAWNQHQSVWQRCWTAAASTAVLHTVQSECSQPAGRPEQLQSHHSLHYIQRLASPSPICSAVVRSGAPIWARWANNTNLTFLSHHC